MTISDDEQRWLQRERFLQSLVAKPTAIAKRLEEIELVAAPVSAAESAPGLEGLHEVERTIAILSTSSGCLPSASLVTPPTSEEKTLHLVRTRLVNAFVQSKESEKLKRLGEADLRRTLTQHFEALSRRVLEIEHVHLTSEQREQLIQTTVDEIVGCGPIEGLLRDDSISEIMVNGPRTVFIERGGHVETSEARFVDDEHMMNVIQRVVGRIGRSIDIAHPFVDARLSDGSRVHAIIPPLAIDGPVLTIRKFRKETLRLEDLVAFGALTPEMAYFLGAAVKARFNIVVAGGTGSGKTSLLNVLTSLVPPDQRLITIEDAAELRVRESHPHVVRLEARLAGASGGTAVTIRDLVRNALRMRPDRIIVGECRSAEALDMLQAMNTGHDGSMTTAHANSAAELLQRIETMCLMAGVDLPSAAIRRQIATAVDLVVHLKRYPDGSRKISEIDEVLGFEEGEVKIRPLFNYVLEGRDARGKLIGGFKTSDTPPHFLYKFEAEGLRFPAEIFGAAPAAAPKKPRRAPVRRKKKAEEAPPPNHPPAE